MLKILINKTFTEAVRIVIMKCWGNKRSKSPFTKDEVQKANSVENVEFSHNKIYVN